MQGLSFAWSYTTTSRNYQLDEASQPVYENHNQTLFFNSGSSLLVIAKKRRCNHQILHAGDSESTRSCSYHEWTAYTGRPN